MSTTHAVTLEARIRGVLGYLHDVQDADGGFSFLRHFTKTVGNYVQPTQYEGWTYFGKCPFGTANIAYHLRQFDGALAAGIRDKALSFLTTTLEHGLVRYVPSRFQPVWFPTDIDDTCMVRKVLRDAGIAVNFDDQILFNNVDGQGNFLTYFTPRWRHLPRPADFVWLLVDYLKYRYRLGAKGDGSAKPLLHEYFRTREPAIAANVLLYLGDHHAAKPYLSAFERALEADEIRIEFYDSRIVPYFHAARLLAERRMPVSLPREAMADFIARNQDASGCVRNGFSTALAALTLMYLGLWEHPSLEPAMRYLIDDPMHDGGWQPFPYANAVDLSFRDGSPELTATLYADAMRTYRTHQGAP